MDDGSTKPIPACHTTSRNALNILDSTNSQKAIFDTAVEFSRILHNQLWVPQLSIYKGLNVRFLSTTGKIGQTSQLSKQSWFLTLCVKVEVKPRRNIVSNRQPSAKEFRGRAGIARARSGQIIL